MFKQNYKNKQPPVPSYCDNKVRNLYKQPTKNNESLRNTGWV